MFLFPASLNVTHFFHSDLTTLQHEWQHFDMCRKNREIDKESVSQYFRHLYIDQKGRQVTEPVLQNVTSLATATHGTEMDEERAFEMRMKSVISPTILQRHASKLGKEVLAPQVHIVQDFNSLVYPSPEFVTSRKFAFKMGVPSIEVLSAFPTEAQLGLNEFPVTCAGYPWLLSIRTESSAPTVELQVRNFQSARPGQSTHFSYIPVTNPFFVLSGVMVKNNALLRAVVSNLYPWKSMQDAIENCPSETCLVVRLLRPDAPPEILSLFTDHGNNPAHLEAELQKKIDFEPRGTEIKAHPSKAKVHVSDISFVSLLPLAILGSLHAAFVGPVVSRLIPGQMFRSKCTPPPPPPVHQSEGPQSNSSEHLETCLQLSELPSHITSSSFVGRGQDVRADADMFWIQFTAVNLQIDKTLLSRFPEGVMERASNPTIPCTGGRLALMDGLSAHRASASSSAGVPEPSVCPTQVLTQSQSASASGTGQGSVARQLIGELIAVGDTPNVGDEPDQRQSDVQQPTDASLKRLDTDMTQSAAQQVDQPSGGFGGGAQSSGYTFSAMKKRKAGMFVFSFLSSGFFRSTHLCLLSFLQSTLRPVSRRRRSLPGRTTRTFRTACHCAVAKAQRRRARPRSL